MGKKLLGLRAVVRWQLLSTALRGSEHSQYPQPGRVVGEKREVEPYLLAEILLDHIKWLVPGQDTLADPLLR